jgi:uncharacterized membrane protein
MVDVLHVLSLFLHILATLVWVGGLVIMSALLQPGVRRLLKDGDKVLWAARKRYFAATNLSLFVLIATGLYQMGRSQFYEGLLQFNNDWSRAMLVKHIAVIGVVGVGAVMQFGVFPALEQAALWAAKGKRDAPGAPDGIALARRERRLLRVNSVLAVVVLFCTALATAL